MEPTVIASVQHRALTRAMDSLLGICSGIISDDYLADKEIAYLKTWLADNVAVASVWPGSAIARRIATVLEDGIVTADERADLLATLQDVTKVAFGETGLAAPDGPALPIDNSPSIDFVGRMYCFTGQFLFGTRAACERAVLKIGAMTVDRISRKLNFLVIGSMVTPEWAHTSFGRKIQTAVEYRDQHGAPSIISEKQWLNALKACQLAPDK